MLGLGEVRLASQQCLLGPLAFRDVGDRADEFHGGTIVFLQRMAHHPYIFDGAIGQQETMLEIDRIAARSRFEGLRHARTVFRVCAREDDAPRRRCRGIDTQNAKGFLRPEDLAVRNAPAEAARVAQALPFRQIGLAAPQGVLGVLAPGTGFGLAERASHGRRNFGPGAF